MSRYLRIHPITYNGRISLKLEVFGKPTCKYEFELNAEPKERLFIVGKNPAVFTVKLLFVFSLNYQ